MTIEQILNRVDENLWVNNIFIDNDHLDCTWYNIGEILGAYKWKGYTCLMKLEGSRCIRDGARIVYDGNEGWSIENGDDLSLSFHTWTENEHISVKIWKNGKCLDTLTMNVVNIYDWVKNYNLIIYRERIERLIEKERAENV